MILKTQQYNKVTNYSFRMLPAFCLFAFLSFGQNNGLVEADSTNTRAARFHIISQFLKLNPQDKIVDIGSGKGSAILRVAEDCPECFFTVEDIDSNSCAKTVYLNKLKNSKTDISHFTFHIGNEKSTTLPDKKYTKVLMFDVIHELSNKAEMLSDVKRILQPEGSLFIEEILVKRKVKKDKDCLFPFLNEVEFKQILKENGWNIDREEYTYNSSQNRYIKIFECSVIP
ncbi:MAG TPA: class I SAM-dependent methyltransferase [Bacteroidia bacterium]|nr:class I SAM-dependent methyltransferase [Bacteroidia bacterium]HQF27804.1 class I SAM-dependent methyltransferase [Bacteroidia bacterium]HQK97080.1 class I SAM-dependent methyltransferase [Bacteroidia bacterium]